MGLKRSGYISRNVAPRKRNPERAVKKFERNFNSKAFVSFTQSQPCANCGRRPTLLDHFGRPQFPNQVSHAECRGMGGCGADWTRTFPMCADCHYSFEHRQRFFETTGRTQEDVEQWVFEHQQAWKEIDA